MPFERKCPTCSKLQTYASYKGLYTATKENRACKACCQIGKQFSEEHKQKLKMKKVGVKHTAEHIERNSKAQTLRFSSKLERKKISIATKKALRSPDIRKKHIIALSRTRWLGKSFDDGQLELLEKWNRLGFQFQPNYQLHTDDFLGYIDGYDPVNKVVLEYDGKYHQKPSQKIRDLARQTMIINILKPKMFWRYDAVNKQWSNVI